MANDNATPNEQCMAHQDPQEAFDSQDSRDPRNWISAQQAIEEIEIEMNRFLSARYSTQPVSPCGSIINMNLHYSDVAPTEIDPTHSTEPAMLVADFSVPGTFLYTPENMQSLRREFRLWHNHRSVQVHPDPARTPRAQIEDIAAFKRRCPVVSVEEKSNPIDTTGWCVQLLDASGDIVCIPLNPMAFINHATCS